MSTINECLSQIVELTRQNLDILSAINESFYTKRHHISSTINGERITIPSFLSLESKIDTLRQDIDNIINAPVTGEAFTYFDGTTQKIELSGYATTPQHVSLTSPNKFYVDENKGIFKDFMSPMPYIRIDISSIPNNIKHVNIHKVVLHNEELISRLSSQISYAELAKILYVYEKDKDYAEYDSIKRLPLRANTAFGNYTIKSIINNYTDSNFDEFYELELNEPLTYFVNNGTIERSIRVGDELVTNNTKVKMIVESINEGSKSLLVRILYGAYANLCDEKSNNPDLFKLRYVKSVDFNTNKYIDIALEEDPYICVFVSPINDTTNAVAPFGDGIFINVDTLVYEDNAGNVKSFRDYYNNFVNNIGDALYNITKMMDDDEQVERLLPTTEFVELINHKPVIDANNILVTQINKHLNDAESVKNIRNLYNQKSAYKDELDNIQKSIDNINAKLSEVSFDDNDNIRELYTSQLTELNGKRYEITQSITKIVQEISINANQSDVPIENAKYHIRGFIDTTVPKGNVIKIDVEYRYKNRNKFTGNAETIGSSYIFSDWNKMDSIYNIRKPIYEDNTYKYKYDEPNENKNEVSFNQIDIPISQGECVDIHVRFIYNYGYPFVEMTSAWSNIQTIEFPEEFLKNIDILDIISENNDDIKKNQFANILEQKGIIKHVDDMIQDQTMTYFHQPEHIASGFFTNERRIIPLNEKLKEFTNIITDLQTEVYGASLDNLIVTLSDNKNAITIKPNIINTFHNQDYENNTISEQFEFFDGKFAYSQLNLSLYNSGSYNMKLHTMFSGNNRKALNRADSYNSQFNINEYVLNDYNGQHMGVWMQLDETIDDSMLIPQVYNQFMYFRTCDDNNTAYELYENNVGAVSDNKFNENRLPINRLDASQNIILPYRQDTLTKSGDRYAALYPYIGQLSNITIPTDQTYVVIKPGESINIPLSFYYWFDDATSTTMQKVSRAIEFDIRPSLFREPITYKLIVEANKVDLKAFKTKSEDDFSMLPVNTSIKKYSALKIK